MEEIDLALRRSVECRTKPLYSARQMRLVPGLRLGPYEVVAAIGAGGLGEVYRARDTTLNRDVALKVLPEATKSRATCTKASQSGSRPYFLFSR